MIEKFEDNIIDEISGIIDFKCVWWGRPFQGLPPRVSLSDQMGVRLTGPASRRLPDRESGFSNMRYVLALSGPKTRTPLWNFTKWNSWSDPRTNHVCPGPV